MGSQNPMIIAKMSPFDLSVVNAGIFGSSGCSGKTVPRGKCALLFDEEDCEGWEFEVPVGYTELDRFSVRGPKKNDAESVLVRPRCKFIGKKVRQACASASF